MDKRLLRELSEGSNRNLANVLEKLEPKSLIPAVLAQAGLDGTEKANSVTKPQRRRLLETLKALSFSVSGLRPVAEALVTAGGITVTEVSPQTMASKLCKGLFFAGEVLDVDGGFNLQIAWATGHAAGIGAAAFCEGETVREA